MSRGRGRREAGWGGGAVDCSSGCGARSEDRLCNRTHPWSVPQRGGWEGVERLGWKSRSRAEGSLSPAGSVQMSYSPCPHGGAISAPREEEVTEAQALVS